MARVMHAGMWELVTAAVIGGILGILYGAPGQLPTRCCPRPPPPPRRAQPGQACSRDALGRCLCVASWMPALPGLAATVAVPGRLPACRAAVRCVQGWWATCSTPSRCCRRGWRPCPPPP